MNWQRPITTRRYLHPPKSERLQTLWSEGKLVFGEIFAPNNLEKYSDYVSSGIWFVAGSPSGQLDFHETENIIRDDGVPVHAVKHNKGGMEIRIEAFSTFEREPSCFIELRLTNTTTSTISDRVGFVLRTDSEKLLIKDGPDMYRSYAPEISAWLSVNYFMRNGDRVNAKEIIDGNIKYAMTSEYYMIERYHENDPYFCPWSPNVSANGRTINMLLDYYV